ncbi:hypothetical protein HDU87_001868 [Geranomyces variabilis]|uniref:Pectinesterase n=1 Tax=Geranomyces variabilis TaxID=109894 RepID=A0AAD5XTR5_9FUNG|nr:hypothetical protein HDU87_001868 [Geranomyces variabilis]
MSAANSSDYNQNRVLIQANTSAASAGSNDLSATLRAHVNDFALYNVDVRNLYTASQTIALSAVGSQGYYACRLQGYQNTLLTQDGTQLYSKTLITGAVDFIFGQRGRANFWKSDIRVVDRIWLTANGRNDSQNAAMYFFNQCTVDKAASAPAQTVGNVCLGRPWRDFARVLWMPGLINADGWVRWQPTGPAPTNVQFLTFNNTGIDSSKFVNFSRELRADELQPFSMATVLNNNTAWIDRAFL